MSKEIPKDRPILLKIDDNWIQAEWRQNALGAWEKGGNSQKIGAFVPIALSSHGCGCCGGDDSPPTEWAEIPQGIKIDEEAL